MKGGENNKGKQTIRTIRAPTRALGKRHRVNVLDVPGQHDGLWCGRENQRVIHQAGAIRDAS